MQVSQIVAATSTDLPNWAQWGILGLIILGFVVKQLVPGWLYADVKAENQQLREENKELVKLMFETQKATIPALQEAANAVNETMSELRILRRKSGE